MSAGGAVIVPVTPGRADPAGTYAVLSREMSNRAQAPRRRAADDG
jgi:hypothetical protein